MLLPDENDAGTAAAGTAAAGRSVGAAAIASSSDRLQDSMQADARQIQARSLSRTNQEADARCAEDSVAPQPDSAAAAEHSGAQPVMLVLVGVPGSGKSTFAEQLAAGSRQSFMRVNQDTIKNGKRGTREQCLARAKEHLRSGASVIIDRCAGVAWSMTASFYR